MSEGAALIRVVALLFLLFLCIGWGVHLFGRISSLFRKIVAHLATTRADTVYFDVFRLGGNASKLVICLWIGVFLAAILWAVIFGGAMPVGSADFATAFNGTESLFAGMALIGVILAVAMQTIELGLQRQELEGQREALNTQNEELRLQSEQMELQRKEFELSRVESRRNARIQGYGAVWSHYSLIASSPNVTPIGAALARGRMNWATRQVHELLEGDDPQLGGVIHDWHVEQRRRLVNNPLLAEDWQFLNGPEFGPSRMPGFAELRSDKAKSLVEFCENLADFCGGEERELFTEGDGHLPGRRDDLVNAHAALYHLMVALVNLDRLCKPWEGRLNFRVDAYQAWVENELIPARDTVVAAASVIGGSAEAP